MVDPLPFPEFSPHNSCISVIPAEANSKVLQCFEETSPVSSLDLSRCDLRPPDSAPLFRALEAQHGLALVNLSANRLRDEAMPHLLSSLGSLPSLSSLDLSDTGITHQVNVVKEVVS